MTVRELMGQLKVLDGDTEVLVYLNEDWGPVAPAGTIHGDAYAFGQDLDPEPVVEYAGKAPGEVFGANGKNYVMIVGEGPKD